MFEQLYEMSENFSNKVSVAELCKSNDHYLIVRSRNVPLIVNRYISWL